MAFGIFGNPFRFPDGVAGNDEREHFLGDLELRRRFLEVRLSGQGRLQLRAGTAAAATRRLSLGPLLREHAYADRDGGKREESKHNDGTLHKRILFFYFKRKPPIQR